MVATAVFGDGVESVDAVEAAAGGVRADDVALGHPVAKAGDQGAVALDRGAAHRRRGGEGGGGFAAEGAGVGGAGGGAGAGGGVCVSGAVAVFACVALAALAALVALTACVAFGTVPSEETSIWAPLKVPPIFTALTAPFLIFAAVTEFFFSCLVPTLFFGSWVAASAPPPRAMNRARVAITFA